MVIFSKQQFVRSLTLGLPQSTPSSPRQTARGSRCSHQRYPYIFLLRLTDSTTLEERYNTWKVDIGPYHPYGSRNEHWTSADVLLRSIRRNPWKRGQCAHRPRLDTQPKVLVVHVPFTNNLALLVLLARDLVRVDEAQHETEELQARTQQKAKIVSNKCSRLRT